MRSFDETSVRIKRFPRKTWYWHWKWFHCQLAQLWVFSLTVRLKTKCCRTQDTKYFIQSFHPKMMGKKKKHRNLAGLVLDLHWTPEFESKSESFPAESESSTQVRTRVEVWTSVLQYWLLHFLVVWLVSSMLDWLVGQRVIVCFVVWLYLCLLVC